MTLLAQLQAYFDELAGIRDNGTRTLVVPLAADAPATVPDDDTVPLPANVLLVCTPATFRPAAPIPSLNVVVLTSDSATADIRENLDINERGFYPDSEPMTDDDAEVFRPELVAGRAFTARLAGEPVAAGMFSAPLGGIAELAGITTLTSHRRRGIAGVLTSEIARAVFAVGVDTVILSTDNPAAYRLYRRLGFEPIATLTVINTE